MPRPAQPTPGLRAAGFHAHGSGEPGAADILQVHVFAFFPEGVQNALLGQAAQQQAGGVRLGVAAHHHDLAAHFGQPGHGVLRGGGLADAAFAVNCYFAHNLFLCSEFCPDKKQALCHFCALLFN